MTNRATDNLHSEEPEPETESATQAEPVPQSALDEADTPEELQAIWKAEGPEPAGGISNLVACGFTCVFGLVGMFLSWRLGLGSMTDPGPGLFPFVVAFIAAVLSAAQIFLGRQGGDGEKITGYSTMVAWGALSLVVFVAALPIIGFEIPSVLLSFVWMKFLGGEKWRMAALGSVIVVAAFYAIFVVALRTQIPHLF